MRPFGLGVAAQRVVQWFAFGLLPAIVVVWWLTQSIISETGDWGFDLLQFWQGGNDVVHGRSPYPSEALLATADDSITGAGIRDLLLILLLLAVAWRWRDRRWVPAAALAGGVVLKPFLWPLLVWLLATRRAGEAARCALLIVVAIVAGWAAIGFDGLTLYPELIDRLTAIVADRGFSLAAVGAELGLPGGVARALPLVAAVPLLALVVVLARRAQGDRRAFSLAVVTCIVATPIVWLHYFTLLAVPLALARPRLAWAWGLMWVFWLAPAQENQEEPWRIAVLSAACTVMTVAFTRTREATT